MKPRPILVRERDGSRLKLGTVKATKGGSDVYLYMHLDNLKVSRHGDGNCYSGPVGPESPGCRAYEMRVPTSSITVEPLTAIPLPSDTTVYGTPYEGPDGAGFEFSSTALKCPEPTFGAVLADPSEVSGVLDQLGSNQNLSSSTHFDTGIGKEIILFVIHQ